MKDVNTGGPAFPVQDASRWQAHGMTLRDYFAAKAMQGLLAGNLKTVNMRIISTECYAMADAMLKAREP